MIDKEKRERREAMLFYSAAKVSLKYKGKSVFEKIFKILLEGSFVSESCQDCSKDISGGKTKKKPISVELQSWSFVNFQNTRPENFPFQVLFHFNHSYYTQPYMECSSSKLPCPQIALNYPEEKK